MAGQSLFPVSCWQLVQQLCDLQLNDAIGSFLFLGSLFEKSDTYLEVLFPSIYYLPSESILTATCFEGQGERHEWLTAFSLPHTILRVLSGFDPMSPKLVMLVTNCFTASVALLALAFALPAPTSKIKALSDLRLIKTSEADFGTWITEEEKISNYKANKIPFIDITDIEDPETLKILCGGDTDISRLAAVRYPTSISHQDEANTLIAKLSTQGPKIWLKTLTK